MFGLTAESHDRHPSSSLPTVCLRLTDTRSKQEVTSDTAQARPTCHPVRSGIDLGATRENGTLWEAEKLQPRGLWSVLLRFMETRTCAETETRLSQSLAERLK